MRKFIFAIVLVVAGGANTLLGQTIGAYGSAIVNVVREKSDFEIDAAKFAPALSFNIGGYLKMQHSGKIGFISFLDYSILRDKVKSFTITSNMGEELNEIDLNDYKHYLSVSGVGAFYFDNAYAGLGLTCSYLLASRTKTGTFDSYSGYYGYSDLKEFIEHKKVKNGFYAPLTLSVPILFGYTINRFDLMARINVGVTNRLKGDTFVKEFNNTVQIGLGYSITN